MKTLLIMLAVLACCASPGLGVTQTWLFPPPDLGDPNTTRRNYNDFHLSIFIPRDAVVPDPSLPLRLWTDTGDTGNGVPDVPFEPATLRRPPGEVIAQGTLGTTIQTDWDWTGANGQANNCASWWEAMVTFDPPLPPGSVVTGEYTLNGGPLSIGPVTGMVPEPSILGSAALWCLGAGIARRAPR